MTAAVHYRLAEHHSGIADMSLTWIRDHAGSDAGPMAQGSARTQTLQLPSLQAGGQNMTATLHSRLAELRGLYRGVVGAASGAGIIIGTYFAFYSTTKRFLRRHSNLNEGKR